MADCFIILSRHVIFVFVTRLDKFESLKQHSWLGRLYNRLNEDELIMTRLFILSHEDDTSFEFEQSVNRMFVDKHKPKRYLEIMELLTSCIVVNR